MELRLLLAITCGVNLLLTCVQANKCYVAPLDPNSFKESGYKGYAMRCNNTGLHEVPKIYPNASLTPPLRLLDLGTNNITRLDNMTFLNATNMNASDIWWLYLTNNSLTYISSDAFVGLTSLVYMNLTQNNLVWSSSFGRGVFKPLASLADLNLKMNIFTTFDDLDEELVYLKNLRGLFINPMSSACKLGPKFRTLENLTTLSLSAMKEDSCNMGHVTNDTFENVPTIANLWMKQCNVSSIDANALAPLKARLVTLDLSYNEELRFSGMNRALFGLRNSTALVSLTVNRIHERYGLGVEVKLADIENLQTLQVLQTLHMDLNKIEVFEQTIFVPTFKLPKTMRNFTLSGNRMTYDKYILSMYTAVNVTKVDISTQHLNYDPFYHHDEVVPNSRDYYSMAGERLLDSPRHSSFAGDRPLYTPSILNRLMGRTLLSLEEAENLKIKINCTCTPDHGAAYICLPEHLSKLQWHTSFIYAELYPNFVCGANNLRYLGFSGNLLHKWHGPIFGLQHLKHLDLSDNKCDNVTELFFYGFEGLQHLNISHNYLRSSFDPNVNPNATWILNTPVNMTSLDMSSNALYTLPQNLFAKMEKLETLILRFNNLAKFEVTLVSKNLSYLDLYNNKLDRLNSSLTSYLDSLVNSGSNVTLDIGNNKIDCSECDTLPTIKWLLTSTVTVLFAKNDVCHVGNKQFWLDRPADRKAIEDMLERKCADRTWESWAIGGGSAIIGAVIAILGGTSIYRNRWKIRYYYYNWKKRRYVHEGFERLFTSDAYISYSKGMASNIKRVVVPVLEGQHGLKLWVTDRDSEVGKCIPENIIHGICNSAKCVFLIDEGFLKEEWCTYDLNMALVESVETKRSMIIIVLMDHTLMQKLPLYIHRILQKERSLEYPEHSENLDTFWSNLADEIRS